MIRLGGVCPSLTGNEDPYEIARVHKDFGYSAANCPIVSIHDKTRINDIRKAFQKEDVLIAEVGAWKNMLAPEENLRSENYNYVCEALAVADEVGALCCIDFSGSVAENSRRGPHPDNLSQDGFDRCVDLVRKILDDVKPKRAKFCFEMMHFLLPDSPEIYLELYKAIDRPGFGVHLDPANIVLSPRTYYNTGELIRRCFRLLGDLIVSSHAKDIIIVDKLALHFDEVLPGKGILDYRTYLSELNRLPGNTPLLLEHLQEDEYAKAREYLLSVAKEIGVEFYK